MKAQNRYKWMIIIFIFLAACQKDEEVLPLTYCQECESFKGLYNLVRVETPSCRYTINDQPCLEGKVVIDGKVEITEFGEFKQDLIFWTGEGPVSDSANLLKCSRTFAFEVVNDSTIRINFEQCGKQYYTYAYFRSGEFRHEYGYCCFRHFEKVF